MVGLSARRLDFVRGDVLFVPLSLLVSAFLLQHLEGTDSGDSRLQLIRVGVALLEALLRRSTTQPNMVFPHLFVLLNLSSLVLPFQIFLDR